jgi:hypothetical protein
LNLPSRQRTHGAAVNRKPEISAGRALTYQEKCNMANEMPTLNIPKDVIEPIIQANITAAIASALGDKLPNLERAIERILYLKVNDDGQVDRYDSNRGKPWIEWAVSDALRKHAKAAIDEALKLHADEIGKHLRAQLVKKNSPLLKQIADAMAGALVDANRLRFNVNVSASVA